MEKIAYLYLVYGLLLLFPYQYDANIGPSCGDICDMQSLESCCECSPTYELCYCDSLSNSETYTVKTTSLAHGSVARYTCIEGYTIGTSGSTTSTRTCQSGRWSGLEPKCTPVDCGPNITTIAKGQATPSSGTVYLSTATVICNNGYNNPSPSTVTCQFNGVWSYSTCPAVDCGSNITTITNGRATASSGTLYQTTAPVVCNVGNINPTPGSVKCQANGTWSSATCSLVECGSSITTITNGEATPTSGTVYQSTASVTCNSGYENPSSATVTCDAFGVWSSSTCTAVDCGSNITTITNGRATASSGTWYLSTAAVVCDVGYINPTPVSVICQANGTWSSATCSLVDCGSSITTITNGEATPTSGIVYQSTASVTCNSGYENPSSATVTCDAVGVWSSSTCTAVDCGSNITTITNGRATASSGTWYQSTAPVVCNVGYINPTPGSVICQANGAWSSATCSPVDCGSSITTITNGEATPTSGTVYQSSATVTCHSGYENPSPATVTCDAVGVWSSSTCTAVDCGSNITTITNGRATASSSTWYQSTAAVVCNSGYINPTPSSVICQANGAWSSATCSPVDCGSSITTITNGEATPTSGIVYQSTASVTCNSGYENPSSATITCDAFGVWSSSTCTAVDCGSNITTITNGRATASSGTWYQSTAAVVCDAGYISPTSDSVICQANGAWSSASCSPVAPSLGSPCPDPSTVNLSPGQNLCSGFNVFCLQRNTNSQDYTCQCGSNYYDDNGNNDAGQCRHLSDLGVHSITFSSITTSSMRVSWVPPADKVNFISGYTVQWRLRGTSVPGSTSQVISDTFYDINNGVESGRAYTIIVTSLNRVNYTGTVKSTFTQKEQALKPRKPGSIVTVSSDFDAADQTIDIAFRGSTGTAVYYEVSLYNVGSQANDLATAISNDYLASLTHAQIKNGYRYDVTITAVSERYDGVVFVRSETHREQIETVVKTPQKPKDITISDITSTSCRVSWDMEGQWPGDTTYTIIVDADAPVTQNMQQVIGFDNRTHDLTILEEYWNYTVTIRAETSAGSMESDPETFRTLPAAPGKVASFRIIVHPNNDYNKQAVEWQLPVLLERNSVIDRFVLGHNTSAEGEPDTLIVPRVTDDAHIYRRYFNVTPEVFYRFSVYAVNVDNVSGVETYDMVQSPPEVEVYPGDESNIIVIAVGVVVPVVLIVVIVIVILVILGRRKIKNTKEKAIYINDIVTQEKTIDKDIPKVKRLQVTNDSSEKEVAEWLKNNGVARCGRFFQGYNGEDILKLSKEDLSAICGATDGIRIYNRLRTSGSTLVSGSTVETPSPMETGEYTYAGKYTKDGENTCDGEYTYARDYINIGNNTYADLDDTKRDGVPYENVEMDKTHVYSSLQL